MFDPARPAGAKVIHRLRTGCGKPGVIHRLYGKLSTIAGQLSTGYPQVVDYCSPNVHLKYGVSI